MLHRRSGFQDLLTTVGDTTGAGAALVEKDYWVTEALRPIAADFRGGVVFKGGTSLSKAWNLIRRFSEDVDLLIRQDHGRDTRGARDRYMKDIESAVGAIDGLTCTHEGARSERGISRTAVFRYTPRTAARDGLNSTIILEMGIRGGPHPTSPRPIQSILAAALSETGVEDEATAPFELVTLSPRRTLVEKLFAVNSACVLWREGRSTALQRQARHLYDIHSLLGHPDISAFIGTHEYHELITEIDHFSREFFLATTDPQQICAFSTLRSWNQAETYTPKSKPSIGGVSISSMELPRALRRSMRASTSSATGCDNDPPEGV